MLTFVNKCYIKIIFMIAEFHARRRRCTFTDEIDKIWN